LGAWQSKQRKRTDPWEERQKIGIDNKLMLRPGEKKNKDRSKQATRKKEKKKKEILKNKRCN